MTTDQQSDSATSASDPVRDRRLMHLSGGDVRDFLQNLVTNAVPAPGGISYSALLTPQGKFIADFFMVARADGILIDVADSHGDTLMQRLSMYKLRADVAIAPSDLKVRLGTGPAPEGALADPRDPAMGWRLYGAEAGDDGSDWDAIRVAGCIPATGIELTGDTFILEAGFERLHGVDFRKGCYVGQEVTARMKHKTELRKGLAVVDIAGDVPPGTDIEAGGKAVGQVLTRSGDRAIAYLRFDRAGADMAAGDARVSYTPAG